MLLLLLLFLLRAVKCKEFIANVSLIHSYSFSLQGYTSTYYTICMHQVYQVQHMVQLYYNFWKIFFIPNYTCCNGFFWRVAFSLEILFSCTWLQGNLNYLHSKKKIYLLDWRSLLILSIIILYYFDMIYYSYSTHTYITLCFYYNYQLYSTIFKQLHLFTPCQTSLDNIMWYWYLQYISNSI